MGCRAGAPLRDRTDTGSRLFTCVCDLCLPEVTDTGGELISVQGSAPRWRAQDHDHPDRGRGWRRESCRPVGPLAWASGNGPRLTSGHEQVRPRGKAPLGKGTSRSPGKWELNYCLDSACKLWAATLSPLGGRDQVPPQLGLLILQEGTSHLHYRAHTEHGAQHLACCPRSGTLSC